MQMIDKVWSHINAYSQKYGKKCAKIWWSDVTLTRCHVTSEFLFFTFFQHFHYELSKIILYVYYMVRNVPKQTFVMAVSG